MDSLLSQGTLLGSDSGLASVPVSSDLNPLIRPCTVCLEKNTNKKRLLDLSGSKRTDVSNLVQIFFTFVLLS